MLRDKMKDFERKFSHLEYITDEWYWKELKIKSMQKFNSKVFDSSGGFSEEWFRARLLYAILMEELISPELIGLELEFKKGSINSTNIEPDILIFRNSNWKSQYKKYINDFRDNSIFKDILMVGEGKKSNKTIEHAIYNQMFPVMQMAQRKISEEPVVLGFYFDSEPDPLLFKLEGLKSLERYSSIHGNDLNLNERDNLNDFPSYELLNNYLLGEKSLPKKDISSFGYEDLKVISDEKFNEIITHLKQKALTTGIKGISDIQQRLITEVISLKIYDEDNLRIGSYKTTKFYYKESDTLRDFKKRYEELIKNARLTGHTTSPYKDNDYKFIKEIVWAIQQYNFTKSQNNTFNQAIFNNFGDNNIKTDLNQFFTPIPMMKSIVGMINPKPDETVYDPCSGICDFLSMAFLNAFGTSLKTQAQYYLYGSEINPETADLGKLNLSINGERKAPNIFAMDSANYKILDLSMLSEDDKQYVDLIQKFEPYDEATGKGFRFTNDGNSWEYVHPNLINTVPVFQADNIVTNPPFGEGQAYKQDEIPVELYELAYKMDAKDSNKKSVRNKIDKGIIFLENAYRSVKPGGKIAIVLSNSLMSKNETTYVREWLLKKVRIVALIDFPQKSFADVDIATTVIIAYKPKTDERSAYLLEESDYEYFSKNIENDMIGYTKSDSKKKKAKKFNPIYMVDKNFEHINLNFINPLDVITEEEIRFIYLNLQYSHTEIDEKVRLYAGMNRKKFYQKNFEIKFDDLGGRYIINEKITSMVKEFKSWMLEMRIKEPNMYEAFLKYNNATWFGKLYEANMD